MSSPTKTAAPAEGPSSPSKSTTAPTTSSDAPTPTPSSPAKQPAQPVPSSPPKSSSTASEGASSPTAQPTARTASGQPAPTLVLPPKENAGPGSSPSPTAISMPSASPPVLAAVQVQGGPMSPPPQTAAQAQNGPGRAIPPATQNKQTQPAGATIRKPNRPGLGGPTNYAPPTSGSALSSVQQPSQQQQPQSQPPAPGSNSNTPSTSSALASNSSSQYPALHLTPLNDTFVPKQISLAPAGTRVKIGRQTNAKTIPNGVNGFFDSKVLSRMHAEVWSEDGKVLIKDVKSSNGTFINGVRLSPEGAESDMFELHSEDVVEFGIDIVSEDNKTIVHHKVAAKVFLVMNADDALVSSREFNNWYRQAGDQSQLHRRGVSKPQNQQQNNSGLSFEHVLSRLSGELQKSRDTSTNLGDLSSTLGEVHDTLGGGAPPAMPNGYAIPAGAKFSFGGSPKERDAQAQTIAALQAQLNDTQASLAGHVGQMKDLEGLLAEHDGIKREVGSLRQQMVEAQRDMELMLSTRLAQAAKSSSRVDGRESPVAALLEQEEQDDEDDARSIASVDTVTNGRPSTTTLHATNGDPTAADEDETHVSSGDRAEEQAEVLAREKQLQEQNARLSSRLETLSAELDEATKLGQALRSQHAEAAQAIRELEDRVKGLEQAVEGAAAREVAAGASAASEVDARWHGWREAFEASWQQEREGWNEERGKLLKVVEEWEQRRQQRTQRRAEREASRSSSSDSDDSDDGDGDDDDDDKIEEADSVHALNGAPSSKSKTKRNRGSSTRRRRRSTATQANLPPALASSIGSASALSGTTKVASDSDDTVGGEQQGASPDRQGKGGLNGPWQKGGHGSHGVGGQGGQQVTYGAAGAVFVLGAVTAWMIVAKVKE